MTTRRILASEAADLLGDWGDRRLRPLCTPGREELDTSMDPACDAFLAAAAEAPWRSFADVPRPILQLAWMRVLFAVGAAQLDPDQVIAELPEDAPRWAALRLLIGGALARTRIPAGWLPPPSGGRSPAAPPTSWRKH